MPGLPATESLWVATAPESNRPQLTRDLEADVAVLGAGMLGVSAAVLLAEAGRSVVMLDMHRVGMGVTGYTSAKVTSQHQILYSQIEKKFGEDGARAYGQANEDALARIARWAAEGIECDFEAQDAYVWTEEEGEVETLEAEYEAALRAGLPATLTSNTPLPFPALGALRFENQAQFHPRKFALGMAERFEAAGGQIFEQTRATSVKDGSPARVGTDTGATLTAGIVVLATHFPFLDRGLFFARMHPERSYCIAARLEGPAPEGMHISAESPSRSIRRYGEDLLVVGGEGHKSGQEADTRVRYERLEAYARERFDVREIPYRWSAQDAVSADGVPFVGKIAPGSKSILTATAFGKWGLTNGVAAAVMLADRIQERENPWASTFDSSRLKPSADLVKENADVGVQMTKGHLSPADTRSLDDVGAGEGAIVRVGREKLAVHRDAGGGLHAVSAVCTHLYCQVAWNTAERSWDCPCHGSRFDPDGRVLEGPAVKDLAPKEIDT
ncbi:MAG: FAD-dependent oxidoreductase [Thermoleophilaceae bacterium]|nr:FAD-dependent oxidoreductase [Thermoleophilaceae bacterium]